MLSLMLGPKVDFDDLEGLFLNAGKEVLESGNSKEPAGVLPPPRISGRAGRELVIE